MIRLFAPDQITKLCEIITTNTSSATNGPKHKQILDWFIEIIKGDESLINELRKKWVEEDNPIETAPANMQSFLAILLEWFTGNQSFNSNYTYGLYIYNSGAKKNSLIARTCSYRIDVPIYIESKIELMLQLVLSIKNASLDFQFA